METILIVDDQPRDREIISQILQRKGYDVVTADGGPQALKILESSKPDLMLLDLILPGMDGLKVLEKSLFLQPDLVVIMLTGYGSIESAVASIKLGAYDYLEKAAIPDQLVATVEKGCREARSRNRRARLGIPHGDALEPFWADGESMAMSALWKKVEDLAPAGTNLVIEGLFNTGKEWIARTIHGRSRMSRGPFVIFQCGDSRMEFIHVELYGREVRRRYGRVTLERGYFHIAQRGTLFMVDIHRLPMEAQALLFRSISRGVIRPFGSKNDAPLTVRIISTTTGPLDRKIRDGTFHRDLYHALARETISIPSLSERREDIPRLAENFLKAAGGSLVACGEGFSDEVMGIFVSYPWPGDVMELRNVVESAAMCAQKGRIEKRHLPEGILAALGLVDEKAALASYHARVIQMTERGLIMDALKRSGGNAKKAAEDLGISLATFYRRKNALGHKNP